MSAVRVQRVEQGGRDAFVVATLARHGSSMLSIARRHSLCADDAHDAYQRAVEILLRRAPTLDERTVGGWLRTVTKHEAMALRDQRLATVDKDEVDLDAQEADGPSEDERVVRLDRVRHAAEALVRLKPQQARALVLLGQGHSYQEIGQITGWSHTKVNRLVTEGRRSLMRRVEGIEAGEECARWARLLEAVADGEATARDLLAVRPHLRRCAACRATVRAYREVPRQVAALIPLAALPEADRARERLAGVPGFLARLHEAIAGGVHDRVIETVSAGKVAAIAASTAALASGGYVAGVHLVDQPHRAPAVHAAARSVRHHHDRAAPGHARTVNAAYRAPAAHPTTTTPAATAPARRPAASSSRHDRAKTSARAAATELSVDGATDPGAAVPPVASGASGTAPARSAPAAAPSAPSAPPASGSEFGP